MVLTVCSGISPAYIWGVSVRSNFQTSNFQIFKLQTFKLQTFKLSNFKLSNFQTFLRDISNFKLSNFQSLKVPFIDSLGLPFHPENRSNARDLPTSILVRSVLVPQPAWPDRPWACLSTPKTFLTQEIFQRSYWFGAS